MPEHGDDTLGISMKGQISAFPFELAFGVNRLGHNVHTVFVGGLGDADVPAPRAAMDAGFAKLDEAHTVAKDAPVTSAAAAAPSSTLKTGGPGAYSGTSEDGVAIELALPASTSAPLAGEVADYLSRLGGRVRERRQQRRPARPSVAASGLTPVFQTCRNTGVSEGPRGTLPQPGPM